MTDESVNKVVKDVVIEVQGLSKLYGINKQDAYKMLRSGSTKDDVYKKTGVIVALWDINMEVEKGKIMSIIGLSGSGKSTLIRCLNSLNKPSSGKVLFEGKDISKFSRKELLDFRRNKISMVFQSFALMDHRNVLRNVQFGLDIKGVPQAEGKRRSLEMIEMVGLSGMDSQPISSLSGGMRQRVGIARALANDPDVLLMDEPFSALDPLVRSDMQFELLSIQRKLGKTVVFITHDINEAFKLGDKVAIMLDGKIIQTDTPEKMSVNPRDEYVKRFIDSADKTRVLNVRHIMVKPSCLVRIHDAPLYAVNLMKKNETSSAFVIDEDLRFCGILTIDNAILAHNSKSSISDHLAANVPSTDPDVLIADIMTVAAEARYPIVVLDSSKRLMGIVSRASVLSSLI